MPERMLVVSDLHLNIGLDADTMTYDRRENFLADAAFADWLAHYRRDAPGMLVIAGDAFDFIRIDLHPTSEDDYRLWARTLRVLGDAEHADRIERLAPLTPEQRRRHPDRVVSKREKRYGLRTDEYKTVWKLLRIVGGHEPVFDALAHWIHAGGRIVIIKGNHDLELHWPLVRRAIRMELAGRAGLDEDTAGERIVFEEESFLSDNVYVEHGHRWEAMTAVHTETPWLPQAPDQISLPLGSFVNRYLINGIERLDPFIDNVKPVGGALTALLRRYPFKMFTLYLRGWMFLRRALRVKGLFNSIGSAVRVIALVHVPVTALVILVAFLLARILPAAWIAALPGWLASSLIRLADLPGVILGASVLGFSLPALLPVLSPLLGEIARVWRGLRGGADPLLDGAGKVGRHVFPGREPNGPRSYVVMGHTHWQEVRGLGGNRTYMNCGTWVPIWPRDRNDLAGRVFYSFLEFTRPGPGDPWQGRPMRWNDDAREPRISRLLSAPD